MRCFIFTFFNLFLSWPRMVVSSDLSIWGKYNNVLGESRMVAAFESADIFGRSVQTEAILVGRNQLGCFSYQNGADFAKEYRSYDQSFHTMNVSVFYVNKDDDIMCFTIDYPDEREDNQRAISTTMTVALERMIFSNKIQDALKINENIYEGIDGSNAILENLSNRSVRKLSDSIKVSLYAPETQMYRREQESSLALEFRTDIDTNFSEKKKSIVNALKTYDMSPLRRNFGVSTSRGAIMNAFADALQSLSSDFQHRDMCNLENMKVTSENNLMLFSLPEIADDNTFGTMCMAYIASVCAMDDDAVHVFKFIRSETLNYRARSIVQNGNAGSTTGFAPYTEAGLTGLGQIVGVADTGLDESSCYFYDVAGFASRTTLSTAKPDFTKRKVVQYTYLPEADVSDVNDGHGTHVCGTVAGMNSGSSSEGLLYNGVAPGAKLAFMDLAYGSGGLYVPFVSELYPTQERAGARINTNSWGSPFSSTMFYFGADVDQYLYQNPQALILFAAGNYGYTSNHRGTITQQCSSKNVVAVGSSETTLFSDSVNNVAYYSSEGPANDGRIKPDIIAPGASLFSARSNGINGKSCSTVAKSGTSMASPAAAGAAALIMQYFEDAGYWAKNCNKIYWFCKPIRPSGLLLKVILLHSGSQLTKKHGISDALDQLLGAPPDNVQGYGRIQLSNVLPLNGKFNFDLYFADLFGLAENSATYFKVYVAESSKPLKITIGWYDPPGSALAARALINDISMSVSAPDSTVYYGNGGKGYDVINVNEQIYIPKPVVGLWKVKVFANALPKSGYQTFSIVITCGGKTFNSKQ